MRIINEMLAGAGSLKGFKQVLELIKAHHALIVSLFGTGIGHYLQFLESQLLVNVLLRLAQRKIVALPLHDCIVVQACQAERVASIMESTALVLIGNDLRGGLRAYGGGAVADT